MAILISAATGFQSSALTHWGWSKMIIWINDAQFTDAYMGPEFFKPDHQREKLLRLGPNCVMSQSILHSVSTFISLWESNHLFFACQSKNVKKSYDFNTMAPGYSYDFWIRAAMVRVTHYPTYLYAHHVFLYAHHDRFSNINKIELTHWGRVTHICIGKLTIIKIN